MEKGGGQLEVPLDHLAQHVVRAEMRQHMLFVMVS